MPGLTPSISPNARLRKIAPPPWPRIRAHRAKPLPVWKNRFRYDNSCRATQRQSFSWASVAASAIAAPISASVNNSLFGNGGSLTAWAGANPTAAILAKTTTNALVSATTRLAVVGGKLQWESIAADSLSNFVSQSLMDNQRPTLQAVAQKLGVPDVKVGPEDNPTQYMTDRQANTYNEAILSQIAQSPDGSYDKGSALDAALGAGIADRVTDLRAQIKSGNLIDTDGSKTRDLNVATDALLSKDAYYKNGLPGLLPDGVSRLFSDSELKPLNITAQMLQPNDGSNFMAGAYLDANRNIYVIADKGTVTLADWKNNLQQGIGLRAQQYADAAAIATAVKFSTAGTSGAVEYTGHSLGGGLASLQALIGNAPAVTFNAAGLNAETATHYGVNIANAGKIDAYYVSGEPLSTVQDHTLLPDAIGNRIPLAAYNPVQTGVGGLVPASPMNGLQVIGNSVNGNLHFMGAVESSIYSSFAVFKQ